MKVARYVVLGIALVAGGTAAFLVGSGDETKVVGAQDFRGQAWPAATTGGSHVHAHREKNQTGARPLALRSLLDANNNSPPPDEVAAAPASAPSAST